jgi:hypothetical protein
MAISNTMLLAGGAGLATGALVGVAMGRNIGAATPNDNPWPELLGIFGAMVGGVLFATIANGVANPATTTTTTTTSNSSSNGITTLPPAGA